MERGDIVESIHTGNKFIIEYISKDSKSFVLVYQENADQPSRCYSDAEIKRSFKKVNP